MSEKHPSLAEAYEAPVAGRRQPQPGDVLDGTYRVEEALGRGGVGVVHAATHLHVQRPCAVKFLHPQLVGNPELRARFRREAQSAFQLGHPHIVSITDFRDDSVGWPYLVMELVSGANLRERLDDGPLPPELAVRLMMQLCDALHTAHRRGVVHRDLKPENLFLVPTDGTEGDVFLKVLDFGLSKILDGAEITETGRLLGSPSYMSPEQARGDSHLVDARSDIFAVGSLLYECLVGDKLFEAPSFEQKRQRIMAADLPPLDFASRGLPVSLEAIIRKANARQPEDRYQTAAEMLEALGQVYDSELAPWLGAEAGARNPRRLPSVSGTHIAVPVTTPADQRSGRLRRTTPSPVQAVTGVVSGGVSPNSGRSSPRAAPAMTSAQTPPPSPPAAVTSAQTPLAPPAVAVVSSLPSSASPALKPVAAPEPPLGGAASRRSPLPGAPRGDQAEARRPAPLLPPSLAAAGVALSNSPELPSRGLRPHGTLGWAVLITGGFLIGGAAVLVTAGVLRGTGRSAPAGHGVREEPAAPAPPPERQRGAEPAGSSRGARERASESARISRRAALRRVTGESSTPPEALPPPIGPALPAPSRAAGDEQEPISFLTVNTVMMRYRPAIVRCFPADVPLPRRLVVDAVVQPGGQVSQATTELAGEPSSCVVEALRTITFPALRGGDPISLHFEYVNLRRE